MPRFKDSVLEALRVIEANQGTIISLLKAAETQESSMKADLSDVLKAVQEQNTVNKSIEALVDGFATKLEGMSTTDGTVAAADLAALASAIRANNAEIQAKVTANTPAAPPVVAPPVVNPPVTGEPAPPPPPPSA